MFVMDIADRLAEYVHDLHYRDLPVRVVEAAKKVVLDTLASMIAGTSAPGIDILVSLGRQWGGSLESTAIGFGEKLPAPQAVMINGAAGRARDIDEVHDGAVLHSAVSVVPVCLGVAEWAGAKSGEDFLTAVVAGVEVIVRLGLSLHQSPNVTGISSTWQMGTFGACAAAGKLLGLNKEQMRNALGIAYTQTAGNQQAIIEGTMMVRVQQGLTAKSGLLSAIFAQRGMDGPRAPFQGKFGYFPVYHRNEYDPAKITSGLGKSFEIENCSLKPYPCCKAIHSSISSMLKIKARTGITVDELEQVKARVNQAAYNLTCHPVESKRKPSSIPDAQFSLPYTLAVAIRRGDVFIQDYDEKAIRNKLFLDIAQKVEPVVDAEIEKRAGRRIGPAILEVRTKDGRIFTEGTDSVKGDPQNPMTFEEVEEKFRKCKAFSARELSDEKLSKAVHLVKNLEKAPDVSVVPEFLH
jgi:2-methylcitrate dehydratase PrpD